MPRCLGCGNTKRFRRTITQYRTLIVSFDTAGNVVSRSTEHAEPSDDDAWPWLCDVCDSDQVDIPDDQEVS